MKPICAQVDHASRSLMLMRVSITQLASAAVSAPQTVSSNGAGKGLEEEEADMLDDIASDTPGPLDLLAQASTAKALSNCVNQLSGDQRHSLALAYYQGLSHSEVADHLGQPLGTVKSWLRRGLQGLKTCLERASMALS